MAQDPDPFDPIRHQMRYHAVQHVVQMLLAAHFKRFPDPAGAADDFLDQSEQIAKETTTPRGDPAISDYAAQEFRLVLRSKTLATGEPFDPEAYLAHQPKRPE